MIDRLTTKFVPICPQTSITTHTRSTENPWQAFSQGFQIQNHPKEIHKNKNSILTMSSLSSNLHGWEMTQMRKFQKTVIP